MASGGVRKYDRCFRYMSVAVFGLSFDKGTYYRCSPRRMCSESKLCRNAIAEAQVDVEGIVEMNLYRGHCYILGRSSPKSLYSEELVSMDVEGE